MYGTLESSRILTSLPHAHAAPFDASAYLRFRNCNLILAAKDYAQMEDFQALEVHNTRPATLIFTMPSLPTSFSNVLSEGS